jgi:hypothetical protein
MTGSQSSGLMKLFPSRISSKIFPALSRSEKRAAHALNGQRGEGRRRREEGRLFDAAVRSGEGLEDEVTKEGREGEDFGCELADGGGVDVAAVGEERGDFGLGRGGGSRRAGGMGYSLVHSFFFRPPASGEVEARNSLDWGGGGGEEGKGGRHFCWLLIQIDGRGLGRKK